MHTNKVYRILLREKRQLTLDEIRRCVLKFTKFNPSLYRGEMSCLESVAWQPLPSFFDCSARGAGGSVHALILMNGW